ncbi:MAG: oligosaccharide flippase family protein [Lachnospiraceae bacterium]|nr:oligosaccharide flippase family protein [Lachnospiraceae bacterium]
MKKYVQLLKNTGLFAISNIATKFIQFAFLPLYTAYLTTADYAIVDMSFVIQSLFWPILSLSLTDALLRFAMDQEYDTKKVFTTCSVLMLPGFAISVYIFSFVNINDTLFLYRKYFLTYYLVISINSYFSIFARAINKIKLVVINSVLSSLMIAVLNIVFLLVLNLGVEGYFYSLILGNLVTALVYFYYGKYFLFLIKRFWNKNLVKELLVYSIPLIPNSVFWWVNSSLDKFCLTTMVGLSEVGLYAVSGKISSMLNIVTSIFSQAWSISVIKEYKDSGSDKFFTIIFNIFNILILFMSFVVIISIKLLAKVLFSNEFYLAWKYVPYLVIAFYFNALNVYFGSIFTAYKKTNLIFWTTGAGAIINLFLNVLMIKSMGTLGAAIATIISNMIVYIARIIFVRRYVTIRSSAISNCILPILLMILSMSMVSEISFYISAIIFGVAIFMIAYEVVVRLLIPFKRIRREAI